MTLSIKPSLRPTTPVATLPGPAAIPWLGAKGALLRFFRHPIHCLRQLHARYGEVAAVSAGDPSLVCAFGPELNRQVLSNPDRFHNAAEFPIRTPRGSALERLTTFLVGMNGEEHKQLRRAMLPLFQRGHLESHRDAIAAVTERAIARWRRHDEIDLSEATAELSMAAAFRCLFDLDVDAEARALAQTALGFMSGVTSLPIITMPLAIPGAPYWRFMRLCERLELRLGELVAARKQPRAAQEKHDALSVLVSARGADGSALPDALLVGLANELFIGGHETIGRTLAWTLFLLERHPQVLSDLLDELSGVLRGDAPTLDQMDRLPLLDRVIKESMRLLPAIPFLFFRRSAAPVRLGNYDLPEGAKVIVSPFITQRMPELYPDPHRFHPERWSGAPPGPYAYLPFGAGPRTCLGVSLAGISLRIMLPLIVQRHGLALPPDAEVSYQTRGIVLGTKRGLRMRVEHRGRPARELHPVRGNIHELVELR